MSANVDRLPTVSDRRASNHPADRELITKLAGDLTGPVKSVQTKADLVRRNWKTLSADVMQMGLP
jgi:hypothetical protein